MVRALKANWIAAACVLFVLVNALLVAKEFYWLNLLPVGLLILWAMLTSVDRLLLFIAFTTPLSINLEELELGGIGIALPTEPLLVGIMVLFLLKLALERDVLDPRVWRHPITWVILAQLGWMLITIVPSTMPVVSIKFFVMRMWFVTTMYFLATRLFQDTAKFHSFIWAYLAGLAIVVTYTLIHHAQFAFAHDPAHWVMSPFFKDHTSYGAIIAFFIPFMIVALRLPGYSRTRRGVATFLLALLITGLIFSFTRAAWLSLVGALGVYLVLKLRVPVWALVVLLVTAGGVYWANEEQITLALERNREESSDDLGEHVKSISNISSDASNLERINRWNSAIRMFQERPVFGWGPGTYMFQYAPFQASAERTIISTNFGLQGNAHSEYLGPLAEQGVPGMLLMIALVLVTGLRVMRLYARLPDGTDKRMLVALFLGLVTYYLHGVLNNFLDLDKASVPFWAFTAMIVLLDLKYAKDAEAPVAIADRSDGK
jgi:putative inorganic carbon (HCO3(-)) transporter